MINQMVVSTEIEWIGYDEKYRILQIEFLAGGTYQYDDVPAFLFQDFLNAPSHGRFFEEHIKGRYAYRRIR